MPLSKRATLINKASVLVSCHIKQHNSLFIKETRFLRLQLYKQHRQIQILTEQVVQRDEQIRQKDEELQCFKSLPYMNSNGDVLPLEDCIDPNEY